MILQANQARLVVAGKKTQIRLPVVEPRTDGGRRSNGTTYDIVGNQPHIGRHITISVTQTIDGKPTAIPHCNILVLDYRHSLLEDSITTGTGTDRAPNVAAIRAEGHRTTDDFKAWWVTVHDRPWVNNYTLKHETMPGDETLIARFDRRHTHRSVWVIEFEHDRTVAPRYLATTGHGDQHGYTTTAAHALPDELPAIDEIAQRRISDDARAIDGLRAAGAAEELLDRLRALDTQIVSWRQQVTTGGFNVRDQVRMLQRARDGIEREIRAQVGNRQAAA